MTSDADFRHGRHVVSALHVHLIFVTLYQRDAFNDTMLTCCQTAMRKVCHDFGATLREFNEDHDHVHLLVGYPPKVPVSSLVNSLKGVSARRLRSQFTSRVNQAAMHGHFWPRPTSPRPAGAPP